ncbi:adenosylcobalamin-dependent ribonucleoside-triphosphate reductase [mine drainage metagenome]|uniref:Adenosylcobalamin-dependent ribonucleoside-triphosphate reductase n=1 Tax=mine drainage metagenome TaxID=410659 RepID=A0A1J5T2M4_9ZZZZ
MNASPASALLRRFAPPAAPRERLVVKRDGRLVPWDAAKITRAIALAYFDVQTNGANNPDRDDVTKRYGVDTATFMKAMAITERAKQMIELVYRANRYPSIEQIQDIVEKAIATESELEVAKSYIIYRQRQAERRLAKYEDNGLADYIAVSKYARYRADLQRRETYGEAVARVAQMHRDHFYDKLDTKIPEILPPELAGLVTGADRQRIGEWLLGQSLGNLITRSFDAVRARKVLPSMRSLQFGGIAILRNHSRMFNCAYSPADRVEFFGEYYFLLLSGTGCGFSVQKQHVGRLPTLPVRGRELDLTVKHFEIADTIEGWSDGLIELFKSYIEGYKVEFNFSKVRPRGTALKTSGGKAPGHLPLKQALAETERILAGAAGRKLRPIEVYDICMHVARSVLSGGIRRSATICLFSADDEEMMTAKTGDWFAKNPQRSASNNSAIILRGSNDEETFRKLFQAQKEFGEPGFYFTNDLEFGCNPCCEIGLHPVVQGPLSEQDVQHLRSIGYEGELGPDTRLSGWQMCNLTTINGAIATNDELFLDACLHAAVVGTLQAAYTKMPYLGPVTRFLNERDALLGVSICGMMDNPEVLFNPATLERGARLVRVANCLVASLIGIRSAARLTCVKPEGTASLLLGAGSGIHPHHARRYFRRVQANRKDPVYLHFRNANPHMTESSVYNPDADDVITFPVEAPKEAILRDELSALDFLEFVKLVQQHWVQVGTADESRSPGLHHNVSNTCTVQPDEWDQVASFIWTNRDYFTGISLLAHDGDKRYPQAPREEVTTEEDISKWNRLKYATVDYTQLSEKTDETKLKEAVACAGGACEIIHSG